mgnify:CR=1 FL=1
MMVALEFSTAKSSIDECNTAEAISLASSSGTTSSSLGVGSGESSVTLQLRSPTMIAIGDPVSVHVSVRAEWESVGLGVLIVIVAGLIIVGIIRTVRRRRRGDVGAEAEGTDGGADATDAAEEASADAFLESTDVTEERTDG